MAPHSLCDSPSSESVHPLPPPSSFGSGCVVFWAFAAVIYGLQHGTFYVVWAPFSVVGVLASGVGGFLSRDTNLAGLARVSADPGGTDPFGTVT